MSTATKEPTTKPMDVPTTYEQHQADVARRKAEREKKADVLDACLDPTVAAEYEIRKPHYYWTVSAEWKSPDHTKGGLTLRKESRDKIMAKDENEAYAKFCDLAFCSRSRRLTKAQIKRGKQVPVETVLAIQTSSPYRDGVFGV